jgi:hypothetical protein
MNPRSTFTKPTFVGSPDQKETTMTEPKQPKKRVVSKAEYVAYKARKMTLEFGAVSMLIASGGFILIAVLCCLLALLWYDAIPIYLGLPIALLGAGMLIWGGIRTQKMAEKLEPVLPPTRHNLELLSAAETLLRASDEPTEGQEKILLRATLSPTETPPEQLLRPTDTTTA